MTEGRAVAGPPELSVVIVTFGSREGLVACLESLARQSLPAAEGGAGGAIEIVVPCDSRTPRVAELRSRFPDVHFPEIEGERTYAELRTRGILDSTGRLVAITEAQCVPADGWCAEVVRAHAEDHSVIGGTVEKHSGSRLGWATYLSDYSRYMNPVDAGPAEYLTDCNVSYKRAVLDEVAELWQPEFHETTVHWKLAEMGHSLWLQPSIVVYHERSWTLGEVLEDRFQFGRLFASTRVEAVSGAKRWLYAATSCLLPPLVTLRAALNVRRKGRHFGQLVLSLPALALTTSVWAFGEFVGYVTGRAGGFLAAEEGGDPGS